MITYKGNKYILKGKHFIYENSVLEYKNKIYGDKYLFTDNNNVEFILEENDLSKLSDYHLNETNLLEDEEENTDELKEHLLLFLDDALAELDALINSGGTDYRKLLVLYKNEVNYLNKLHKNYTYNYNNGKISLEAQRAYFDDLSHNISNLSFPNFYTQLNNFINSLSGGDSNATI